MLWTASLFPGTIPMRVVVPLGVAAVWCALVSWVRIMQGMIGSRTVDELVENIKKEINK